MSGDQKVVSVYPSSSVGDLQKLAAAEFNWENAWTITFADGNDTFGKDPQVRLVHLSLGAPCELMVLRRAPWCFKDLGCSSYNENYVCSVLEVREVGPLELELDFIARGDKSLGALPEAEASVIKWLDHTRDSDWALINFSQPRSITFTTNTDEVKKGTMRFDVRPSEVESFSFGERGYSELEFWIKNRLQNET
eukprot:Skav225920  [mRNA]  locus=scaffold1500:221395:221976:- [translate_table: standard]